MIPAAAQRGWLAAANNEPSKEISMPLSPGPFRAQLAYSYAIVGATDIGDLSAGEVVRTIDLACRKWAEVTPFSFQRVDNSATYDFQVRIGPIPAEVREPESGSVLGCWVLEKKEIVISDTANWTLLGSEAPQSLNTTGGTLDRYPAYLFRSIVDAFKRIGKWDLLTAVAHEIGHLLYREGGHLDHPDSIMRPRLETTRPIGTGAIRWVDVQALAEYYEQSHANWFIDHFAKFDDPIWLKYDYERRIAQVAVGIDESLWAIDTGGLAYFLLQESRSDLKKLSEFAWPTAPVRGGFKRIAAGDERSVFALDSQRAVHMLQAGDRPRQWQAIDAGGDPLRDIAVSRAGNRLYALSDKQAAGGAGAILRWDFDSWPDELPARMKSLFGSGSVSAPHRLHGPAGKQGQSVLTGIAVGSIQGQDDIWCLDSSGVPHRHTNAYNTWQAHPASAGVGKFIRVAAGVDGTVVALDAKHQVYRFEPATGSWKRLSHALLTEVAVLDRQTMFGVNIPCDLWATVAQRATRD